MVSIVAAMDENFGIGYQNKIPWYLPEELKHFKSLTSGGIVIMGRKTYDSIGYPLPNRVNVIISRQDLKEYPSSLIVAHSVEDALNIAKKFSKEIFVIGGGEIYKQFLEKKLVDRLCLSFVQGNFLADTFFPMKNFENYYPVKEMNFGTFIYKEFCTTEDTYA
jgi:dihydrofolate reductase